MVKLWSETNPKVHKELRPDLGLRCWNDLNKDEKNKMWNHLVRFFFDKNIQESYDMMGRYEGKHYQFFGDHRIQEYKQKAILNSIIHLNENYKCASFAKTFLEARHLNSACSDFHNIFMMEEKNVVLELLSAYGRDFYGQTKRENHVYRGEGETEEEFAKRKVKAEFAYFDAFAERLNDVFLQFGIGYHLTREGLIPRQESRIIENIYEPVLEVFSQPKWKEVNDLLVDAFADYRKNTPHGYSHCVTNVVSSVQAFLQIVVHEKTGKGEISKLIPEAQEKDLIPRDSFTQKIFKDIESIFARERQEKSIAHPKKQYSDSKHALLMLNLAMVFFQHCIQK